jgi:WD40 repeat protein
VKLRAFEGSILTVALGSENTVGSKNILAVTDSGGSASLWYFNSGEAILNPLPINNNVTALAFNLSGEKLALGTRSGTIILWDVARQEVISELSTGGVSPVSSLAFSNEQLVSSNSDGSVLLWKVDVASLIQEACRLANPPLEADTNKQHQNLNAVCP